MFARCPPCVPLTLASHLTRREGRGDVYGYQAGGSLVARVGLLQEHVAPGGWTGGTTGVSVAPGSI